MSAAASFDIDDSKQPQPKPAPAVRRSMSSMSSMSDSAGSAGWEVVAQEFAGVPYQETAVATPKPNARSRGRPRKNNVIRPIEGAVSPAAIVAVQAIAPAARACQAMEVYGSAQREQIQQFTDAMQRTHISLSPLQQYLFAAARDPAEEAEPKQIADDQDDWDGALLERFLQAVLRPERPVAAAAVLEQQLKSRVSNFIEVVGSAFTEAGLGQWDLFLRACVTQLRDGKARGLFFIRQRYYDETPLRLRHKADGEQPRITKVLQSHLRLGLVMEDAVTQQISCYFGHVPTWLQALQEAKGEDILAPQLQIEGSLSFLDVCSESFASTLQLVTTDRAGSNYKAETGFQHLKPHAKKLHLPCDVHKTSVATTTMFSLASGMLTAMVNYGLMFRAAGSLAKFRLCLMEEIESNFRLVIGMRPAFAAAYQAEVFHVFLNNSHSNSDVQRQQQASRAWQKQVLSFFMNGDLQDETVTWYAPFDVTREQALKLFRTFVPRALLPRCVPVFPRHRWHGCEVPLDALGLVASHCNLLQGPVPKAPAAAAPPMQPEARAKAAVRKKLTTESVLPVPPYGSIHYNPRSKVFIAHCKKHGLGVCKKQRTVIDDGPEKKKGSRRVRPLGFLMAWLEEQGDFDSKNHHVFNSHIHMDKPKRASARQRLKAVEGAREFFVHEAGKGPGSDSEPDLV